MMENVSLIEPAALYFATLPVEHDSSSELYASNITIRQLLGLAILISSSALYFHSRYLCSISNTPGPFLAPFGTCWQLWQIFKGRIEQATLDLHEKHGARGLRIQNHPPIEADLSE